METITGSQGLRFSFQEIPLSQIDRDPGQPRQTFDEDRLRELANSIREEGLIQLPVIKPNPTATNRYLIIAGERRIRALGMNGVLTHPFIIADGATDTFRWSLVENLQREDLNPIEEAQSVKRCRNEGMTWEQISALTGKHYTTLSSRIKLLDLPEEIKQMIVDGKLPSIQSANNLAQFKNTPKGRLIQMAHSLIAGEQLLELSEHKVIKHEGHLSRFLPSTPVGLMQRILDLARRAQGAGVAMQEFSKLPEDERRLVWNKLQTITRKHLLERNVELQSALAVFIDTIRSLNQEELTSKVRPKRSLDRREKKAPLVVWKKEIDSTVESTPTTKRSRKDFPPEAMMAGAKVIGFLAKAVSTKNSILLSKTKLAQIIGDNPSGDIESIVVSGLRAVQTYWRSSINDAGDNLERKRFILLVSNCRYDLGDQDFAATIKSIKDKDCSSDPVNLEHL